MSRQPRALRLGILAFELCLVILIAYQASGLMFRIMEPEQAPLAQPLIASRAQNAHTDADTGMLSGFDPFFRAVPETSAVSAVEAAPESSLKLELFGLRAMGDGKGSAIVKTQDGSQQVVRVGDIISPGVKLAGVYKDRLEIIRSGSLEAVYLRPQGERTARPMAAASGPTATSSRATGGALSYLANLQLEPVRRDRRIIGFRLPENMPEAAAAFGLEGGDILLAANGEPLNSFERISEIGEELAGARRIDLTIERRGETRSLSLGL